MDYQKAVWSSIVGCVLLLCLYDGNALSQEAYKINGKSYKTSEIYKANQGKFYDLEKKKYQIIENLAYEAYLQDYWQKQGAKAKPVKSAEAAKQAYLKKNARVSESEIKETLERFKNHSGLAKLSDAEKRKQVTNFLKSSKERDVLDEIIQKAISSRKLVVSYPKPQEPIFSLPLQKTDIAKYGPKATDIKPQGCSGDSCPITVIEYSEYQCPFCVKVLPTVNRLLTEYKGRIQWVVRDFPLGFHDRAKPAAVAAHCAGEQGKYWQMYETLFQNQRNLADADLESYGKKVGLNQSQYKKCLANPEKHLALIEANYKSGEKVGVTGTPAFFINGRRLSGALPYDEFKRVIEEELAKKKTKS